MQELPIRLSPPGPLTALTPFRTLVILQQVLQRTRSRTSRPKNGIPNVQTSIRPLASGRRPEITKKDRGEGGSRTRDFILMIGATARPGQHSTACHSPKQCWHLARVGRKMKTHILHLHLLCPRDGYFAKIECFIRQRQSKEATDANADAPHWGPQCPRGRC